MSLVWRRGGSGEKAQRGEEGREGLLEAAHCGVGLERRVGFCAVAMRDPQSEQGEGDLELTCVDLVARRALGPGSASAWEAASTCAMGGDENVKLAGCLPLLCEFCFLVSWCFAVFPWTPAVRGVSRYLCRRNG